MAKYSKGAQKSVEQAMRKKKRGKLKSGGSGRKVKSRKQAIAIGLSEARKKGAKAPPPKGSRSTGGTSKKSPKKKASKKKKGRKPSKKKVSSKRSRKQPGPRKKKQ